MAKLLTTVGNSFHIEEIIKEAEKNLTLVTPYLNLSQNLIDRLTDADRRNINITLIYGKTELKSTEKTKLKYFNNLEIYYCKNLHAKCYFNEHSLIITSMNLYEFSERNNREMGILIKKEIDNQIFEDTIVEVKSIKNSSELKTPKRKTVLSNLIYLPQDKNDKDNFYCPSLHRVLKDKLSNYKIAFNEKKIITIEDCPKLGINISLNGTIDFNFTDIDFFENLRYNFRNKINNSLPKMRVYWNKNCINIYPEKGYDVSVNQEGLENIVNKYSNAVIAVKEQITLANNSFS